MKAVDLAFRYLSDHPGLSESSVGDVRRSALLVDRWFGSGVEGILKSDAVRFVGWLGGRGVSDGTNRKVLRWVKALWGHAVLFDVLPSSPWGVVSASQRRESKPFRMLSEAEFGRILSACPCDEWRRLFGLCRYGGLRRGEALGLSWSCVDVDGLWMRVLGVKTGAWRDVPISPRLLPLLACGGSGLVCPICDENVNRRASVIVSLAGVGWYGTVFHALRKMLASEWIGAVPLADAAKFLGHSETVALSYYHKPLSGGVIQEAA